MDLQNRFSDQDLARIIDEATMYMCACPGQVASEVRQLRDLIRYQRDCTVEAKTPTVVHQEIAQAAGAAHSIMEDCLDRVLTLEGWDRTTLKMPLGLRKLRDELLGGLGE